MWWVYLTMLGSWTKQDQRQIVQFILHSEALIVNSHITDLKLYTATLDNTGNNLQDYSRCLNVRALSGIVMSNNCHMFIYFQLNSSCIDSSSHSCLGHVVNLGNIDVMACITKIAAVKNVTAI